MRKAKEERIIEHGDEILKELQKVYLEGIGIDEYHKLLKEYKRLYRRYEKTIKLSDNMGNEIMEQNDNLNDHLKYTINTARSKLLENVAEHRKTKDAYSQHREKIKKYEEALNESYAHNDKVQRKLNSYIKHYGEINHKFSEDTRTQDTKTTAAIDLNPSEFKNMDIKKVVSLELSKEKRSFIISKIKLKNFDKMIEVIEENSSIDNFIKGTYKYIKNCFHKDDIVFHDELETFYVITKNQEISKIKMLMNKLNKKRKVFYFAINFSIGMTKYIDDKDTIDILLKRCDYASLESVKTDEIVVK